MKGSLQQRKLRAAQLRAAPPQVKIPDDIKARAIKAGKAASGSEYQSRRSNLRNLANEVLRNWR